MRFNEKDLAKVSQRKGQIEGKLHHKEPSGSFRDSVFRERFCKVVGNLLFFFRITEFGTIDTKEPVGLLVLENYLVSTESDSTLSFAFGLSYRDEAEKKHFFTARTEMDAQRWVRVLREASYQYWKDQFQILTAKLQSLNVFETGHYADKKTEFTDFIRPLSRSLKSEPLDDNGEDLITL